MLLDQAKPVPVLTRMRDDGVGGVANTIWMVAATAGVVLLVACANVANLILVRADGRQRELAVRAALGAGRARVVGLFFAESMVLAAIASTVGLAIAAMGIRLLVQSGPTQLPRLAEVSVDSTVVLFTVVIGALVVVACSAIPALRLSHAELGVALRDGGRSGTAGRPPPPRPRAPLAAPRALAAPLVAAPPPP